MGLFGLIFTFMFGAGIWISGKAIFTHKNASDYITTTGRVIATSLAEGTARDSKDKLYTTYSPRLEYTFQFNGETTQGSRIHCSSDAETKYSEKKDALDVLTSIGKTPQVYYLPNKPQNACLDPSYPWNDLVVFIVCIVVPVALVWRALHS